MESGLIKLQRQRKRKFLKREEAKTLKDRGGENFQKDRDWKFSNKDDVCKTS